MTIEKNPQATATPALGICAAGLQHCSRSLESRSRLVSATLDLRLGLPLHLALRNRDDVAVLFAHRWGPRKQPGGRVVEPWQDVVAGNLVVLFNVLVDGVGLQLRGFLLAQVSHQVRLDIGHPRHVAELPGLGLDGFVEIRFRAF